MAFIYEVNGQKVEFEKEPSEADIDEAAKSLGQKPKQEATASDVVTTVAQNLPMAAYNSPTGINPQAINEVLSPLKQAIPQTVKTYAAAPYKAGADLIVGSMGLPPPYASTEGVKGLYNTYKGAQESMSVLGEKLSRPDFGPYKQGGAFPEAVSAYRDLRAIAGKIDPAFSAQMKTALDTGGDKAVKQLLENAPDALKASPEFMAQSSKFTQAMPTTMQQVGRVVGPALRGAARVAGPVGMGMSLYDAGQMTRETDLGSRLQQGQGQRAEQAFRNMNTQYGAPISPEEEQNVMANGSQRDIQALIKRKAAQRVLGPVAPR